MDMRSELSADYGDSMQVLSVWDNLHAVSTLQGVVNRKFPQLYINYITDGARQIDTYWWNKYRRPGQWLAGRDTVVCHTVADAVRLFSREIKGAVVYDTRVASTSNVASAVAGIEDLVAVRYDMRPGSVVPARQGVAGTHRRFLFVYRTRDVA